MTKSNPKHPTSELPYRPCVGIVVFNKDNLVWVGRRIAPKNSEYSESDMPWQMPQGGIDEGEDILAAAKRELWEETGITSVSLLDQTDDWLVYDLPDNLIGTGLKGKFCGQKMMWFAFRFEGDEDEIAINPPPGQEKAEFSKWRWAPLEDLPDLIIPFKKAVYEQVVERFRHLV
jgi:putative (di)nucleoside polyphosphate hydrolase